MTTAAAAACLNKREKNRLQLTYTVQTFIYQMHVDR